MYTKASAEDYPLDELRGLFNILIQPEEEKNESFKETRYFEIDCRRIKGVENFPS